MKTYAMTETVPEGCDYLTAGKWYEILKLREGGFSMEDDVGDRFCCYWLGCIFLHDGNWTRHDGDTPPTNLHDDDIRPAEVAARKAEGV